MQGPRVPLPPNTLQIAPKTLIIQPPKRLGTGGDCVVGTGTAAPAYSRPGDITYAASWCFGIVLSSEKRTTRKPQVQDAEVKRIAIQRDNGQSDESRYDRRMHGLLTVMGGRSCRETAQHIVTVLKLPADIDACFDGCPKPDRELRRRRCVT